MLRLQSEFQRLNAEQQEAVLTDGNTAVMAGPGSGKTATLVIKIAYLLSNAVIPPAGLACITYNNDAVGEFRNRLADLGIHARRGLFLGTVHSFCLNCVVRPYAKLVDPRYMTGISVAAPKRAQELFMEAATKHIPETQAQWIGPTITRFRRARACGEDIGGFANTDPTVADEYEQLLLQFKLIDFEGIILLAHHLIGKHEWIRRLLSARFPWLVVDEYQDLGGPLHRIVTSLADSAGVKVFAVGDPDQTIYDFTGADPKYLVELASRKDFESIRLKFNYRSGQRIIDASQAALSPSEPRGYISDPNRKTQGEIVFIQADGTDASHAIRVVDSIKNSRAGGTPLEEVAVFYRATGTLLSAIKDELSRQNIDFKWERDERLPSSPIITWLQRAAAWTLSAPQEREHTLSRIFRELRTFLAAAGKLEPNEDSLQSLILLHSFLSKPTAGAMFLRDWIVQAESIMSLRPILAASEELAHDLESYDELIQCIGPEGPQKQITLFDFAATGRTKGKVVLTTFHASKGRQFDVVIIPGCAEGLLPAWAWNRRNRRFEPPHARPLGEARRLFYVGLSRARHAIHLIFAESWQDKFSKSHYNGVSRFVSEIRERLKSDSGRSE
jgi:DNA helicase-2/ATP-dependent DNA helicase PcrA